jgi:dihydroxyacetone kinase
MKPKKFINDPSNAVDEYIAGLLLQYPNRLRKLANHRVVLHRSFAPSSPSHGGRHPNLDRVSLLSGGGSGHEPSHAGYVGINMLSGAILGDIFASPPVSSILAAIRAVTLPKSCGGMGCLLIVKNYTGDRLNFGMACELARHNHDLDVSVCVVADDCAVPRTKGITGARGVAGAVLVHKASGGCAGSGMDLKDVTRVACSISRRVGSLGVALDAVTVPGANVVNDRIPPDRMEVGLGIHGEAGMRQCGLKSCDEIARLMCDAILDYGREEEDGGGGAGHDGGLVVPAYNPRDELLLLVNNLGGMSNFEMSLLTRSIVGYLEDDGGDGRNGCRITRVLVGDYMTSFDMRGASATILPLTGWDIADEVMTYVDGYTDAPAWSMVDVWDGGGAIGRPSIDEVVEVATDDANAFASSSIPPAVHIENFSSIARDVIIKCAEALIDAEPELTKFDTIVGDGDCGTTMERGAREVLRRLDSGSLRIDHPACLFSDLADAVSASMGGTSGILLELFFRKAGTSLLAQSTGGGGSSGITSTDVAVAFREGVSAVSFYGGAREGSRTMLDALVPASAAIVAGGSSSGGTDVPGAASSARAGADATATMELAEAGRSNYLSSDVLFGTPDPGAVAVAVVLEAMAQIIH